MIVSCPNCHKKYRVPDEKIGNKPKKLRCRNCSNIIIVKPPAPQESGAGATEDGRRAEAPSAAADRPAPAGAPAAPAPSVPEKKRPEVPDGITRDDTYTRARRLARVLASDMLIYNRELVEQAKHEGNLQAAMAAEIKRSWELWSSRFSREIVEGTNLFREALNEILSGGEDLFSDWKP